MVLLKVVTVFAATVLILQNPVLSATVALEDNEDLAREFINRIDTEYGADKNRLTIASWDYESNLTDYNQENYLKISLEFAEQSKKRSEEVKQFSHENLKDENLKRLFKKFETLGDAILPEEKYEQLSTAITNMKANYAKATICAYDDKEKCDLFIEPEVTDIFANSENADELKHTWIEWHSKAGVINKGNFTNYVTLRNEVAKLSGFDNYADVWLDVYEYPAMEDEVMKLWDQVRPLYQQIHAYARRQLRQKYGPEVVSEKGPIPAHLLGNVWAQTWPRLDFGRPYPEVELVDVAAALKKQNFTAVKMFETANEFFVSMNLSSVPQSFWDLSILEKPDDRDLVCHASAWDFFDGKDVRIKQCTQITTEFFKTTHHELGHIQYYLQYKDQPVAYREGANPGFHEAVGDVIALSVSTPKHLHTVGLLEELPADDKSEINQQYKMILEKIVFLPFALLLDMWRYSVFRGQTTPENYNCHFWALRDNLQGIEPPVARTEEDFDAVAKYHVPSDTEYLRYYISFIVQFQFHRSLCIKAGEFIPGDASKKLSDCDIYKSAEAGNTFRDMLKLGSSVSWPDAMEILTGQRSMDASAVLDYFEPLHNWLKAENEKNGEFIGWETSNVQYCTSSQSEDMKSSRLKQNIDHLKKGV